MCYKWVYNSFKKNRETCFDNIHGQRAPGVEKFNIRGSNSRSTACKWHDPAGCLPSLPERELFTLWEFVLVCTKELVKGNRLVCYINVHFKWEELWNYEAIKWQSFQWTAAIASFGHLSASQHQKALKTKCIMFFKSQSSTNTGSCI